MLVSKHEMLDEWSCLSYKEVTISNNVNILKLINDMIKRWFGMIMNCSYFPLESTQEMLDEWRPLMCLFDVTMVEAMYFFEYFLPTKLQPDQQDRGYK